MKKFIDSLQKGKLNRKENYNGKVISNLGIEPNELMKYVRLVKKGYGESIQVQTTTEVYGIGTQSLTKQGEVPSSQVMTLI